MRRPTPPLTRNDLILIDAVRRSRTLTIHIEDPTTGGKHRLTVTSAQFSYDVSNALRNLAISKLKNHSR